MNNKLFRYLMIFSGILLAASIVSYLFKNISLTGIFLITGFIAMAFAVRGFEKLKGFSYTFWIFTTVVVAMFYPKYFVSIGDFQLKTMIVPLLQIIMFGMGSQMSLADFTGIIKMPKGVIAGVVSHYVIMPLVGFSIAHIFSFPPEIAAGIILIGCVPSGLASNVMSFLARANLALAVTVGAISTLLSPFITPSLMKWLGGQFIEVNFWNMMLDILNMIILPVVAGFTFNLFAKKTATGKLKIIQIAVFILIIFLTTIVYAISKKADLGAFIIQFIKSVCWFYLLPMVCAILLSRYLKSEGNYMEKILSLISMVGIVIILAIIVASGRDSLLKVGGLLIITSILHNMAGYTLGYSLSWIIGLPERDRRTIAFEVGMQNGGLATGLALQMGKVATVGLAPAIFGPLMNVTGSVLANWWRGRPIKEKETGK